ncbi:MAG: fused MFS/spermidine synthase, partial [Elusimicrobiota bacterium]
MFKSHSFRFGVLLFCFFLSGIAALIYEILWIRELTMVLGHSTPAISAVLSAYMCGLGLGSFISGKLLEKVKNTSLLRLYIYLELLIALTAVLSKFFIKDFTFFISQAIFTQLSAFSFNLVSFFLTFFIILIPTAFMGATLPVLSQWIDQENKSANKFGILYGINTLGAVTGVLITGFYLIPHIGISNSYYLSAIINIFAAALVFIFFRNEKLNSITITSFENNNQPMLKNSQFMMVLTVVFLSGAGAMICEVSWTRLFSLILGSSTYAFSIMLSTFLAAFALGGVAYSKFYSRLNQYPIGISFSLLGIAASILVYLNFFNYIPYAYIRLFAFAMESVFFMHLVQFILCSIIMFVPVFLMGITFPWIISKTQENTTLFSSQVGWLYSFNTLGGIIGSALTGLYFLPKWGIETSLLIAGLAYGLSSIVFSLSKYVYEMKQQRWGLSAILGLFLSLVIVFHPSLNAYILSSGVFIYAPEYRRFPSYDAFLEGTQESKLLFFKEGVSSTISVFESAHGEKYLRVNGKTDASSGKDMGTQLLLAYIPMVFHSKNPESALVIGFGSGATAGALGTSPFMKKIDCVELEPAVIQASQYFTDANRSITKDPRFKLIEGDGRHYLSLTKNKYDLIISEPSNPWIAGIGNLYTTQAFEQAKQHLNPSGLFGQWFHAYSMGEDDFKMVLNTFASVFPHVKLFSTDST